MIVDRLADILHGATGKLLLGRAMMTISAKWKISSSSGRQSSSLLSSAWFHLFYFLSCNVFWYLYMMFSATFLRLYVFVTGRLLNYRNRCAGNVVQDRVMGLQELEQCYIFFLRQTKTVIYRSSRHTGDGCTSFFWLRIYWWASLPIPINLLIFLAFKASVFQDLKA